MEKNNIMDNHIYVTNDELNFVVDVARATDRPLLIKGEPGSGKSSFAGYFAKINDWKYYEFIMSTRTCAKDLLWSFDNIKRLREANKGDGNDESLYIQPRVIWWMFDYKSAINRGSNSLNKELQAIEPNYDINKNRKSLGAVLLIDEIDKADPDVTNDLLDTLGSYKFYVDEINIDVQRKNSFLYRKKQSLSNYLIIITTNEERELPQAFLRRCIIYKLKHPNKEQLIKIATSHFERIIKISSEEEKLFIEIAEILEEHRNQADRLGVRKPSTAEYLDAIRACLKLKIKVGNNEKWNIISNIALKKYTTLEEM